MWAESPNKSAKRGKRKSMANKSVSVKLVAAKVTKNTVRFEEELESEFAQPVIGTLYVPKATLGAIGYKEGANIALTVSIAEDK